MLCLALLHGCASRQDESLQPVAAPTFTPEFELQQLWSIRHGRPGKRQHHALKPVIHADRLFMADVFGKVAAYDADSGRLLWQVRLERTKKKASRDDGSFVSGALGSNSSMLFLGTIHGEVIALSQQDGELLWRTRIHSEILAPPQSDGVLVYLQTVNGRLLALEAGDGQFRWSHENKVPSLSLYGTGSPLLPGAGVVIAGFANARIAVFQALTGQILWEQTVVLPRGRTELERIVDVDGALLVDGGLLFAASYQGQLRSFVLNSGQVLWEQSLSTHRNLAAGYDRVYVIDDDDHVIALEQDSATVAWENEDLHRRQLSDPAIYSTYLVIGDHEGYLHFITQASGQLVAYRKISRNAIKSAPLVRGDVLYVTDKKGRITAVRIRDDG